MRSWLGPEKQSGCQRASNNGRAMRCRLHTRAREKMLYWFGETEREQQQLQQQSNQSHADRSQQREKEAFFENLPRFAAREGSRVSHFSFGPSSERLQLCGGARAVSRRVRAKGSATAARLQPRHQAAAAPAAPAALAQIPPVIPHSPLFSTRHRRRRVSRARCAVDSGACKGGGCCCGCGCGCFFGGRPIGSHSRTRA